ELLRNTVTPLLARQDARESGIDATMRQLFDFFADNPNVPKLLMRRIVENEEIELGIERAILAPAWSVFSAWGGRLGRRASSHDEPRLFRPAMHPGPLRLLPDSSQSHTRP